MTRIGNAIVDEAKTWAARQCKETRRNGGSCIDDLQRSYWGSVRYEPYCAAFVWVVVNNACNRIGIPNLLPKTAGARDMRNRARRSSLRVDEVPAPGSCFYRYTTVQSATGHVGIVVGWDRKVLYSIEGNRGNRIDVFENQWSTIRPENGWQFMHTEEMPGGESLPVSVATVSMSPPWWFVLGGAAAAGALELKQRGRT